jgi:UDP-N-acetylglucosamine 2-epimerase (non-hydrolysing)
MKIFLIAGARSNFMKIAPIARAFDKHSRIKYKIVHTGQHYVVGDVNSTLACSITAKKMHIKVVHVGAGLRSFDLSMPEEINRMVTDSISDLFFITEEQDMTNLLKEGKSRDKLHFVGHVMIDNLFLSIRKAETQPLASHTSPSGKTRNAP